MRGSVQALVAMSEFSSGNVLIQGWMARTTVCTRLLRLRPSDPSARATEVRSRRGKTTLPLWQCHHRGKSDARSLAARYATISSPLNTGTCFSLNAELRRLRVLSSQSPAPRPARSVFDHVVSGMQVKVEGPFARRCIGGAAPRARAPEDALAADPGDQRSEPGDGGGDVCRSSSASVRLGVLGSRRRLTFSGIYCEVLNGRPPFA
jgi:hypothetical protein